MSVTDFHPTSQQITSSIYSTVTHGSTFLSRHRTPTFKQQRGYMNSMRTLCVPLTIVLTAYVLAWCWPTSSQHELISGWWPQLLIPPWVVNFCSCSRRLRIHNTANIYSVRWTVTATGHTSQPGRTMTFIGVLLNLA